MAGSNVYRRNYEGLLDSRREYAEASREHWENQAVASSSFLGSTVGQPAVVGVVPAQVASVPSALHVQKQIRMV